MRRSIRFGRACSVALSLLMVLPVSCGRHERRLPESGATLHGTIKHNGEQLQFAMIIVLADSGSVTGKIGDDGQYKVENVPLGEVKVGVNTEAATGDYQSKIRQASLTKGGPKPKFIAIPKQYHDPGTSGFKKSIEKGVNTYDIEVPK